MLRFFRAALETLRVCGSLTLYLCATACLSACHRQPPPEAVAASATQHAEPGQLRQRLDDEIEFTLQGRQLNTQDHGAWQILHGILAYQHAFPIRPGASGPSVPAIDYLLADGTVDGWNFVAGEQLASGRQGLRAVLQPGSGRGQGHPDQWLGYLAASGLPLERVIRVNGTDYTMADYVAQVQRDVARNMQREWSWTLIGLTQYLPTSAAWTAADNKTWSIEQLVRLEVDQGLAGSACGGTHRLIGLTIALNQHLQQGGELTGAWADAQQLIQQSIEQARDYQNPDGSFSANYFQRPGATSDLAQAIGTTGHTLEFLTLALSPEQLRDPWVQRGAWQLCDLLERTREIPLECGALYHAMHGLVVYRQHLFGPLHGGNGGTH